MEADPRERFAIAYGRAQLGVEAPLVSVEIHLTGGLPRWSIVGLPEAAVRESKDRVRGALINSGYDCPRCHITVNLAPADLPKEGARFDLPIAVGMLAADKRIPHDSLDDYEFIAELALTGKLRATSGVLPAALRGRNTGRTLIVASGDADEAALARGARILPAAHLRDVVAHLTGGQPLHPHVTGTNVADQRRDADLSDVSGQYLAKRALEIAAAGGHNLLMMGPPGTGKTMLATRLPGILPSMSEEEALQCAAIVSVSELDFDLGHWGRRPFRAPHHTASGVALVGGGSRPRPGEISLAHNGVLFLDELPEFDRRVLEVLREPLESGTVSISRAARRAVFPARFQLVAAMNPCPCGYLGDNSERCRCSPEQVRRYRSRVSGALLDRIDLQVEVPPLAAHEMRAVNPQPTQTSATVRCHVEKAREQQLARAGCPNQTLSSSQVERYCRLVDADQRLLETAIERLHLSARTRHRVLRVARTIADLADSAEIETAHLAEAIQYRNLDRPVTSIPARLGAAC